MGRIPQDDENGLPSLFSFEESRAPNDDEHTWFHVGSWVALAQTIHQRHLELAHTFVQLPAVFRTCEIGRLTALGVFAPTGTGGLVEGRPCQW